MKNKYKSLTELIIKAKIGGALDLAIKYLSNSEIEGELILLKSRFEKNEKEHRMNVVHKENYDIEYNKITVALLSLIQKNFSKLSESVSNNKFVPEISFDYEFNHFQNIEELISFLNECEYNLNNNVTPICNISFPLAEALNFELNKGLERNKLAAMKNGLNKLNPFKKMIEDVIGLILTKYIHYRFQENKRQQAIALKNTLNGIRQSGIFDNMYVTAVNTGIKLPDLTIWESLKENKVDIEKEEVIFNGIIPSGFKKIDVYNNKSNPRIVHSIWLNSDEMKKFEENLCNDRDFGSSAKEILYMFPGDDTFSATSFLPESVIFEKLIPKAILNTYYLIDKGVVDEQMIEKSINIDNLYVGLG